MSQPVEDDAGELRVSVLPFEELFADQNGLHGLTIGQAEKHSAVVVAVWGAGLVFFQPFQPVFQFLPESGGQKDIPAGGLGFGAFQYERSFAAFQFIGKLLDDTVAIHLKQGVFLNALHGLVDRESADPTGGVKIDVLRGQSSNLPFSQRAHQGQVDS